MPPRSKKRPSQRDRLKGRTRPSTTYYLMVDDDTEARAAVEDARESLAVARMRIDERADEAVTEAESALKDAQAALAACYEGILIKAMPPKEFEALAGEHPPRKDHPDERWNSLTFPPVLFLRCVVSDMTAEEWEEFLDENCSTSEQAGLFLAAQIINARTPDGTVPKG